MQVHRTNSGGGGLDVGRKAVGALQKRFGGGFFLGDAARTDDDFAAAGHGLGGSQAGDDAGLCGGFGELEDGGFRDAVIDQCDGAST